MAFKPTILFCVAHEGATPRLLVVQSEQLIQFAAAGATGFSISTGAMFDGDGTELAGDVAAAFKITFTGPSGLGFGGTIGFDWTGFRAFSAIRQQRLIKAFATGGRVVLEIEVGLAVTQPLPISLRALKTADFSTSALGKAEPAHHPGQSAPNLSLPAGDTGVYTYSCADLGGALAVDADGAITLPAAAVLPPGTRNLQLGIHTELDAPNGAGVADHISADSVLPIDVHVPADVIVLLDRSGSMNRVNPTAGESKWASARQVANLFAELYGGSLPDLASPAGNIVSNNRIALGHFRSAGPAQVTIPALAAAAPAPAYDAALTAGGGTPIGQALKTAGDLFPASRFRQRHVLLLTDGMDNAGTPTLDAVATNPAHLPKAATDPERGVTLHNISYALGGETHAYSLSALATAYGGRYHDGAVDAAPLDSEGLLQMFLNVLSDILPVEHAVVPASVPATTVEDGVERAIFLATEEMPAGSVLQADGGGQASDDALAGSGHGYSWAVVERPRAGTWQITNAPAGASLYVLYDLALRMRCGVTQEGLGKPLKLWAEVRHRGVPVENAEIRAGVKRPGESMGEVTTKFAQSAGLVAALRRAWLRPDALGPEVTALSAEILSPRGRADLVGRLRSSELSVQRVLLEAAERARNLPLQVAGDALELRHVGGGRYEAELDALRTQNEGVYTVHFHGSGVTPEGYPFTRDQRASTVLAPVPDPKHSVIAVRDLGQNLQRVTVVPKSATGKPLGPGLGYALAFQYARAEDQKQRGALELTDNLDGSYSALVELRKGEKLPDLGLYFTAAAERSGVVVTEPRKDVRQVTVTIDKLQVLDDKDPCRGGAGELAFDVVVTPNGSPNRAVRTRIPDQGTVALRSGATLAVERVVYDELVEEGASLSVTVGGHEFDWLLFTAKKEPLARYHRKLALTPGRHVLTPDDEKPDPESLVDWKLWYTVEVQ